MGLSDRDYAREPSSGFHMSLPQSGVGLLMLANIGIFLVDVLCDGRVSARLELRYDLFSHPWNCWQLVTSAFVHNPHSVWHILGNMFVLWMFGSDVERLYGRAEFLRLYFIAAIVAGLCWVTSQTFLMPTPSRAMLGASGAVTCVWVLFALHFPTRMILFWGLFPMPMWLFGLLNLTPDLFGFLDSLRGLPTDAVAFEAHLGGALTALVYRKFGLNFGAWLPRSVTMKTPRLRPTNRPKLKLHQPPAESPDLEGEVDRLLGKINETGIDSLTPEERRTLERASAKYQKRRS
jgi:membrane associated rhomboid family serine protease